MFVEAESRRSGISFFFLLCTCAGESNEINVKLLLSKQTACESSSILVLMLMEHHMSLGGNKIEEIMGNDTEMIYI